jgi:hypothetical protein
MGAEHNAPSVGLDELLGGGSHRRTPLSAGIEDPASGHSHERDTDVPERQPSKPKRSSIPSWDEIVFGTRGD